MFYILKRNYLKLVTFMYNFRRIYERFRKNTTVGPLAGIEPAACVTYRGSDPANWGRLYKNVVNVTALLVLSKVLSHHIAEIAALSILAKGPKVVFFPGHRILFCAQVLNN